MRLNKYAKSIEITGVENIYMALYAIADLHLPLGVDKPMDIFGVAWKNYVERLFENWQHTVKEEDTVVLPGDFSWAMYLDESKRDFEYLNSLNGTKILIKGNHDYWWTTMNKLKHFIDDNGFSDIYFMHNNAFVYKNIVLCGTRGWVHPAWEGCTEKDRKIFARETARLELSLKDAQKYEGKDIYVFTHYPPMSNHIEGNIFTDKLAEYGVKKVIYGHLHGASHKNRVSGVHNGIEYILASADYLQFAPKKIAE